MKIDVKCWRCKKVTTLEVHPEGYAKWRTGTLIQSALPELPPSDRELLISRTCAPCFDEVFRDEE